MPKLLLGRWRAASSLALASLAALAVGCASDESSQTWPNSNNNTSERNEATHAGDRQAASSAPDQIKVARAFPTGNRSSSDLLVEQMGPREVRVGQPYSYQLRVTNLTDAPLTGIVLRQHMSDNFKLSSDSAAHEGENHEAMINIGDLGPKQSKTVDVTGTPSAAGTLDTCLSAQYNPPTLCAQVAIVSPQLKAIAEGPKQVDICQDITYRYTVSNTGTGTAHNVVLREDLPDGLQSPDGGRAVALNVGDLGQGQSKTVAVHLKAQQSGTFNSKATVTSDAGNVQTDQIATQVLAPRLAVTIVSPKEQFAGQDVAYRIDVKNMGDAPAAHTRLRVGATPGQVEFLNAQGGQGAQLASERPGTGQDLGTLDPGQTRTVTINFRPLNGGNTTFDATAQADCAQPVTTSTETSFQTITASALIVTHDPDPVPVGGNVVYHVTVQNKGSAADHNVKVTATLPESEQYVRGSGKTDVSNDGQKITFGPIPTLEPKQTYQWDVVVKALRPDQANFKANMTSDSTPTPAVKVEPTKLFGGSTEWQTHTNVAPEPPHSDNNNSNNNSPSNNNQQQP
jgi:uncharacterized repeat protein (TIGR01451 family)